MRTKVKGKEISISYKCHVLYMYSKDSFTFETFTFHVEHNRTT